MLDGPDEPRLLALEWLDAGAGGRRGAARPRAGDPARGRRRRVRRRVGAADRAAHAPERTAPDWPAFYAERRLRPLLAGARPRRARQQGVAGGRARVRPDRARSPARPSRRRACTATCGAATCCASGGRPCADRPRRLRRPSRGRPRDAAAVRRARRRACSPPTTRSRRSPPATRTASALWQLFPLLVHAVLFGGGYGASVERAARRYAVRVAAHGPGDLRTDGGRDRREPRDRRRHGRAARGRGRARGGRVARRRDRRHRARRRRADRRAGAARRSTSSSTTPAPASPAGSTS